MNRLAWIGVLLLVTTGAAAADSGAASTSQPAEMQTRRQQAGGMTLPRARAECYRSFGYDPGRPGTQSTGRFPHHLTAQISACITQKMRGGR